MTKKAALDWEVTAKLLVAVRFAAHNISAVSHFLYAMKTESVKGVASRSGMRNTTLKF